MPGKQIWLLSKNNHGSIFPDEPGSGSAIKIGSRFFRIVFLIAIVIAIARSKSGSGYKTKIADRFS